MEDHYLPINHVLALLAEKGLTEKGLDLAWKPGTIAEGILHEFNMLQKDKLNGARLNVLVATIPGFFDQGKDKIDFTLTFYYNDNTDRLKFRSMRAVMDEDIKTLYIIGDPAKMDNITEVYDKLNEKRASKAVEIYMQMSVKTSKQQTKHL